MKTEIFYFSGTGNSLFVAKETQKRIPESEMIPIIGLLKKDRIIGKGKAVGFVFPVHALTIPVAVRKFIRRVDLTEAEYIFAIATRYGTVFHGFRKIEQLLKKKKKSLDAQFVINMCMNDSRQGIYNTPSKEEIDECEQKALKKLDTAAEIILARGSHIEDIGDHKIKSASNPVSAFLIERFVLKLFDISEHTKGVNYFYHDNKCTGCGVCEKVCLSEKISIIDGKPVWSKNKFCFMCFACLNFCPMKSVQVSNIPGVKSNSKENGRYPHPYATINDMQIQKNDL